MSGSLISRGKTVEDAIDQGLKILKSSIENVEVEILDNGNKGILLLGARDAKVRLTTINYGEKFNQSSISTSNELKEEVGNNINKTSATNLEDLVEELDHKGWLTNSEVNHRDVIAYESEKSDQIIGVHNGAFFIQSDLDIYPMIEPMAKGVTVYKNGEQINDTTFVSSKDEITFNLDQYEESMDWDLEVSHDAVKVICTIKPSIMHKFKLLNQYDERVLDIKTEEEISHTNFLEPEDILNRLKELRVSNGLDHAEIVKASLTLDESEFVVAEGKRPVEGENGYLDFKIDIYGKEGKPKMNDDGSVDFRETKFIPSVNKGDIIANIHPPIPGIPGKNVYGDVILPSKAHEAVVKAGKGIEVVSNQVIALESGKPQIQTRGLLYQIQVLPTLVHRTDVSIETGNIHFTGDVEIWGNVKEEMTVKAVGDVTVSGAVDHAEVTAGNSVYIKKNTINSHLSAGEGNIVISNLSQTLENLSNQLKGLLMAVRQLLKAKAFKSSDFATQGIYSLLNILLDKKFQEVPSMINTYRQKVNEYQSILDQEWLDLAEQLKTIVRPIPNRLITTPEELETIIEGVDKLYQISYNPPEPNSEIVIANVMNSNIYCSGDVSIIGDGSYHTDIHSGGKLIIDKIVRGGNIYAQLGMYVGEVGSKGGMKTYLSVPADQTISMDYVWEDTVIRIGNSKYRFNQNDQFVTAKLVDEKIVLT
ncbi:FapA family protein [Alkalibacillus salilacus]|uniref:Uncharacterized protein (DUF342 family) n=1 Tax=Alkalibacillus salilacus TaxID=284582 RepID=A0ABT9VIW0_9BACI|nr:FapA family protein [Alkalibacillus salilacus]MDQ0160904.1 uncharacterized protein (DUF342 family) [Alkalibacillus salilacus]